MVPSEPPPFASHPADASDGIQPRRRGLAPGEFEAADALCVEVVTRWGDTVVDIAHVPRGRASVVLPTGATVGADLALRRDAPAWVRADGLTVALRLVPRALGPVRRRAIDRGLVAGALAAATLVALLLSVATSAQRDPRLEDPSDADRVAELHARALRARPAVVRASSADRGLGLAAALGGMAHAQAPGRMGRTDAARPVHRYAIPDRARRPQLAAHEGSAIVADRGVFVALRPDRPLNDGDAIGPTSPFGGLTESGAGVDAASGGLWGTRVGDAFGYGGLDTVGTGRGGGGWGAGTIGLGSIGTIGHGAGSGSGEGYGSGAGRGLRGRATGSPVLHCGSAATGCAFASSDGMSPDAIRRVVLRNLGQVAACQQRELARYPELAGRVAVRFVVADDGRVLAAGVTDSSVPAPAVAGCIATAVRRWQFPSQPGRGLVTVNYPFELLPPE